MITATFAAVIHKSTVCPVTSIARIARNQDVPGIIRLVNGMYADMAEEYAAVRPPVDPECMRAAESNLSERLGGDVMAFVVDRPSNSGDVAAVAVGRVQTTFPIPRRRGTSAGYVEWVATDPEMRRRGLARAAVTELLC